MRTAPQDLTPSQAAKAYKAYYDDIFYAKDGVQTLKEVTDPQARAILADALLTRGHELAGNIVQKAINSVLGWAKHHGRIIGSKTLGDFDALTNDPKTHDWLINAVADEYWDQVKRSVGAEELNGYRDRIKSLRP